MDFQILISNLTNPTLLFFVLGIFATLVKSDLEIPASSSKFISLYLLFAIGFKGGQELAHSPFSAEIFYSLVFGVLIASLIPLYVGRGVIEVSSGLTSKFWAKHGVTYAAPNVAKALREHVGYARRTAKGPQITPNGIKYVEQALSGKNKAA